LKPKCFVVRLGKESIELFLRLWMTP
jgi:hypothetical protein